jgi:Carboxypeptidase regulatory-like domain/TonB dependent receptor
MKKWQTALRVLGGTLAVLLLGVPAFSQANTGRFLGNVADQSGGAISGATVAVTNVDTGVTRNLTTDDAGAYNAPSLTPGNYKFHVEYMGFRSIDRLSVALEVGKEIKVDFSLEPGSTSEAITVTEQLPLVETTNATLGGTLQPGTIQDLPLNGRNFMSLLQLRPGITIYPGAGAWTQSTNGLRPEHNVYLLDGVTTMEPFSAQSTVNSVSLSGDAATVLPIDAIQEFNTQENPKAEYGWKPGAITNIALKSGTNAIHGTMSAYGRDDALDAKNAYAAHKQNVNLEEFGGTIGGPIKKDKAFFFLGYEGQRYSIGNPAQITWPTMTAGAGPAQSVVDACNAATPGTQSPTSLKMAGLNPDCSLNTGGGAYTIFQNGATSADAVSFNTRFRVDNGIAKVDFHKGDKHTFSTNFFTGNNDGTAINSSAITQLYWAPSPYSRAYVIGSSWNYTPTSSIVNTVRFGYSRFTQAFPNADCPGKGSGAPNDGNYGIDFGAEVCGFTSLTIRGFTGTAGCCSSFPKFQGPDTTEEVVEQFSYLMGKHSFKFGGEFRDSIFNGGTFNRGKGQTTFNNLADFITGTVSSTAGGQIFLGNPLRHVTSQGLAGFAQDDWRITQRLTLNLGVRYEYVTPLKEKNGLLANWDPTVGIVQVGQSSDINLRNSPYLPDKNNFAPRIGFAWDIHGDGKTVVRGGGGIIYVLEGFNLFLSQQNANNPVTGLNTNPSGFILCNGPINSAAPTCEPGPGTIRSSGLKLSNAQVNWNECTGGGTSVLGTFAGCTASQYGGAIYPSASDPTNFQCGTNKQCGVQAVNPRMVTPYVENWNLSIQRAINNNMSIEVGYVGNHAVKLLGINDTNAPPVGSGYTAAVLTACAANPTGAGCKPSAGAIAAARPFATAFPYLGYIYMMDNYFMSHYNGLQATLTQRPVHGLSYTVGYTYAHALDDATNDWSGQPSAQDPRNPQLEYSNSGFDIRHRFTAAVTYALPGRDGYGQMLKGWKVTSIVNIQSALPWGVIGNTSVDPSGTAESLDRWNFFGNPADFSGLGPNTVPFFGPGVGGPAITNSACLAQAGNPGSAEYLAVERWGCFVRGGSVMLPPALGAFGTMGRNTFRGDGLHVWDFSVIKDWKFTERWAGEFRFEVFNILNQTQYGNPQFNGAGGNDPFGVPNQFGTANETPDVANNNPTIGSGAARTIQLGFRIAF